MTLKLFCRRASLSPGMAEPGDQTPAPLGPPDQGRPVTHSRQHVAVWVETEMNDLADRSQDEVCGALHLMYINCKPN